MKSTTNMELKEIRATAQKYGWEEIMLDWNQYMVSYAKFQQVEFPGIAGLMVKLGFKKAPRKQVERINYWMTTGTISTAINHPKKGKTQLFRKGLSKKQIEEVFADPRVHTNAGYYNKQ